jgi:hypothetical protein
VETIFDSINLNFFVGIVSTVDSDSFKEGPQIERFGAFLLSKVSGLNLSHPDSPKGKLRVPSEKSIGGHGAFITGCPAFSPPDSLTFFNSNS